MALLLMMIVAVASTVPLRAAGSAVNGASVYRGMCSKCHGRHGEGVKGKYEDALQGNRSLEKLSRYIERAMPDDDPGKCSTPEAVAVADYIYKSFYSREARARNHPARVELVRLTNRQYLNTVADLFQHFTGYEPFIPTDHGLSGTYYAAKFLMADKRVTNRLDRTVDFDFGTGVPDQEHYKATNEFSIEWLGCLLPEETGDYEFMVRTQNAMRLWVNNDHEENPSIDAWVSSGQLAEHRVRMRLIGGRAYPLRLQYFRMADKTASISLFWKPPLGVEQLIPARNFSPKWGLHPVFVETTAFPADDSSVGYERGVSISKAWDEAATQAAIEAAHYAVDNLDQLTKSKSSDTNRVEKLIQFCTEFAATAFRTPLTAEQKQLLVTDQFKKAKKVEDAVKRSVLLTLKSPEFLYVGLQEQHADDFVVASRLSFGLWDSLPDAELEKRAAAHQLHTSEQIARQANRMLNDPRTRAKMQAILHHWLQMDRVESLSKDDRLFPGFTPEIVSDLRISLDQFLSDAVWSEASDYRKLLLADYLYLNNRLAKFYSIGGNGSDDFVKVTPDAKERFGVLTHPYLLAAFSYTKQSSPIHRGVFLTRNIVGRALRPPPMAQTFNDASFAPNQTMREKVAQLTRPQACQSCHSVINPLGFSLENFDAVGRYRMRENDRPIDAVTEYTTDDGEKIKLTGARDIAEFALSSEQAQDTFIEQLFNQVVKQPMLAYGVEVKAGLRKSFVDSHFNMQKLLVEIVKISALHGLEKPVSSSSKS